MAWRIEVAKKYISQGHKTAVVLRICKIARSTWYYQQRPSKAKSENRGGRPIPGYTVNPDGSRVSDSAIVKAIADYRKQLDFMNAGGYHKLKHYLRRDYGYWVNHKKLYRLCRLHDLLLPLRKKKIKKRRKISENRVITGPNQLWEFDIKYGYIHGENRFFFVMAFIDVFSRRVLDFHVGRQCKAGDLVVTLEAALERASGDLSGLMIRSDNGPQMTSNMFRDYVRDIEIDVDHEFIPTGCPNKNAHIESFFSILETEFLQVRYFKSFFDAYTQTTEFFRHYNERRFHGSLKYKTPLEAEIELLRGELKIKDIRA